MKNNIKTLGDFRKLIQNISEDNDHLPLFFSNENWTVSASRHFRGHDCYLVDKDDYIVGAEKGLNEGDPYYCFELKI